MISAITMLLEAMHTQIVLQYSSVHIQELMQELSSVSLDEHETTSDDHGFYIPTG